MNFFFTLFDVFNFISAFSWLVSSRFYVEHVKKRRLRGKQRNRKWRDHGEKDEKSMKKSDFCSSIDAWVMSSTPEGVWGRRPTFFGIANLFPSFILKLLPETGFGSGERGSRKNFTLWFYCIFVFSMVDWGYFRRRLNSAWKLLWFFFLQSLKFWWIFFSRYSTSSILFLHFRDWWAQDFM